MDDRRDENRRSKVLELSETSLPMRRRRRRPSELLPPPSREPSVRMDASLERLGEGEGWSEGEGWGWFGFRLTTS